MLHEAAVRVLRAPRNLVCINCLVKIKDIEKRWTESVTRNQRNVSVITQPAKSRTQRTVRTADQRTHRPITTARHMHLLDGPQLNQATSKYRQMHHVQTHHIEGADWVLLKRSLTV
jgi:hypothetical protein